MPSLTKAPPAPLSQPTVRAAGYSLLAHCFAHPHDESDGGLLSEAAAAARDFVSGTPLEGIPALVDATPPEDLRRTYVALFSLTSSTDCPTYETAFIDTDGVGQARRMATIAGLYRMFGVEAPPSGSRPDDISAELEFMSFLNLKEAYAAEHLGGARVTQARQAQKLFLSEHLGCWGGTFARLVGESPRSSDFYKTASGALGAWLVEDIARIGAVPAMVARAPSLPAPNPFSHGPEFASGGRLIPIKDIP